MASSRKRLKSKVKRNSNLEEYCEDIGEIKILDIIGVIFPKNNDECIKYKLKIEVNGKEEIKTWQRESNIISDELLAKFYERVFGSYYQGQFLDNN